MVVEGLHFIRQKNALRAPACSLQKQEIFQLEEGHQLLKTRDFSTQRGASAAKDQRFFNSKRGISC
jgi:hypothetical protein